ncbi:MAG: Na+/H+ antiporter subunit C [Gammaproteobacteria bacterium]|nr:MAG: Na+/H+ antiporter subunit C [Gammaproteobacteria bacterium]
MIDYFLDHFVTHYNYWAAIIIMMIGLYMIISHTNLVKKIAGLNIFQTAVFLLYVSMGVVAGGTAPIAAEGFLIYSNPLPQVLMLTAIVVGVATTALAFALIVRIKEAYNSVEEDEIFELDEQADKDAEEW